MNPATSFKRVMGLQVVNESLYQQYRQDMVPILAEYGGAFTYDFRIAEVLFADTGEPINRVFCIRFPEKSCMTRFYADSRYLAVRDKYFTRAVSAVTPISMAQEE